MLRWTNEQVGDTIVDIVVSINKFVIDNKITDLCVSANYSGEQPTLNTLDEIHDKLKFVEKEIAALPGHPGDYLRSMNKSHQVLLRWLADDGISYFDAVKGVIEVALHEVPRQNIDCAAEDIDKTLTDIGYTGTAPEKLKKWREDLRIPDDQVVPVAKQYLQRLKEKSHNTVRALPPDKIESVNAIRDVRWGALSTYLGDYTGELTFNIDKPWTAPGLICVLAHEGYPGHHTFYTLWDYLFRQGKLPLEASYYIVDSPTNCLFEGAPDNAIHFVGWDDPTRDTPEISKEDKNGIVLASKVSDLTQMYRMNANYFFNVEHRSREEVESYMRSAGFFSEDEAKSFKDNSRNYQGIYMPCYYYGRWMIRQAYDLYEDKEEFFKVIYDTPQTNATLIKTIEKKTGKPFEPFKNV